MRTKLTAVSVVVVSLLAAVIVRSEFASEQEGAAGKIATDRAAADSIAAQFERLGREYEQLAAARDEAIPADNNQRADVTLSDQQWLEERRATEASAPNPDTVLPKFVAFARNHQTSPLAFDALFFVVSRTEFKEFRDVGNPWPVREQALELAWADHRDDPRMVHLLDQLHVPSRQSELFLKRALETSPNSAVRAAAAYHLAGYYRLLAVCHMRSQRVNNKSTLNNGERIWKLVVTANLEKYAPLSGEENSKIEDLLGQVIADFSDVPATKIRRSGPGGIFIKSVPFASPKTYGNLAATLLNELTNIVPGKPAPEIVGTDADGNTFRLSDYRGRVVLLTFSANSCPGCVKFYPLARRLQEKYRDQPFVILGVNRDEKIDTLKSAIAEGEITWRCWWDGGTDGPIRAALNATAGSLFLLDDQQIIQDCSLGVTSFGEEFEQAIEPFLEKAIARGTASL